jgi:DNA-binding SARP family transcriptional activator/tetratricopeptide (TPR) repeat protein
MPGSLRIAALGPLRAWRDEHELQLGTVRQQAVLAVLAVRAGRPVSRGELIDAVWGEDPPATAENGVHTYIARLRRVLEPARGRRAPGRLLVSTTSGYLLRMERGQFDVDVFDERLSRARQSAAEGDAEAAIHALDTALSLWRGPAFAGIRGPFVEVERACLEERRLAAVEERAELLLRTGRHVDLAAELPGLVREFPLRERLRELLMQSLYRCGRQADALAVFRETRQVLSDELGVEPTANLQRLHRQILVGDPALAAPLARSGPAPEPAGPPSPFQLPHDVADFTGRYGELAQLRNMVGGAGATVLISALDGAAGVGKTALAVHIGHQVAGHFPDGQLFLDLRGFHPHLPPMPASEALGQLLWSLGVDQRAVPSDLDKRVALYRSLVARKRLLLVLDNAATAEQVRPLLPGRPTCVVIVTSRDRLGGLVARDGARRLTLDVLRQDEARTLLVRTIGAERVAAEPEAAAELARLCGYLPLALRIAADRVAVRPRLLLRDLVDRLGVEYDRLNVLATDGDETTAVRAVFSWSYQALSPGVARLFRLLGLHTGPDISVHAAAALADLAPAAVHGHLDALTSVHLLEDSGRGRYRLHDLLRVYAAEHAAREPEADRVAAIRRVLAWYVHTAAAADRVLAPQRRRLPLDDGDVTHPPIDFATPDQAFAWCEAERANLVAATARAAHAGLDSLAWKLPVILWAFFSLRKHWADWISTHEIGLAAARRIGDRYGERHVLNTLGSAYLDLGQFTEAIARYERSLAISRQIGDRYGEATTLNNLGQTYLALHRYGAAFDCIRQALGVSRDIGDRYGEGFALHTLGRTYRDLGRYDEAIACLQRAIVVSRAIGDQWDEACALHYLGDTCLDLHRVDEAMDRLRQALAIRTAIGDRRGEAVTLQSLGAVLREAGERRQAIESLERAVAIFDDVGDPRSDEIRADLRTLAV